MAGNIAQRSYDFGNILLITGILAKKLRWYGLVTLLRIASTVGNNYPVMGTVGNNYSILVWFSNIIQSWWS